jgi:parvulin-like peptidyl-prolyl isomerase
MSFRNRPVFERKHRPRWQDELRSQQLLVAGFALAIAVAVGIFGAAAWSTFHEGNLRQAALVDGTPVQRAEVIRRIQIIAAELQAASIDLQAHAGGTQQQAIERQLSSIEAALGSVVQTATDSAVNGLLLDHRANDLGGQPSAEQIDAEIDSRRLRPARWELSLIIRVPVKDEGADEVTDEDWAEAKAEIEGYIAELEAGADFGALAVQHSADPSAPGNGLLGWIDPENPQYGKYAVAAGDAEAGELVGPLKSETGWYMLRVEDREEAGRDEVLDEGLASVGVTDAEYREYVRQELMVEQVQDYFANTIVQRFQPQREIAEILIQADTGFPVPMIRIRHLLASPLPGADDQSGATDKQWAAARRRAQELREAVLEPDANWFEIAEQSDDKGSGIKGGDLGWADPTALAGKFVPTFASGVEELELGEVSDPVRSPFGYHVIQVVRERSSAMGLAVTLSSELRDDPDAFADVARNLSEDVSGAKKGGEVGWVIHYQYDQSRDRAIFDLLEPGDISDPVSTSSGIYVYKLLDTSESRFVSRKRRDSLGTAGFNRWLDEMKTEAGVWLDTEFAPTAPA